MTQYFQQKQTTKDCPCGRGKIMTGHNSQHNAKVDGKQACMECYIDSLYRKVL